MCDNLRILSCLRDTQPFIPKAQICASRILSAASAIRPDLVVGMRGINTKFGLPHFTVEEAPNNTIYDAQEEADQVC